MVVTACGDGRTPLVVYSPHGRHHLSVVERAFEAAHPDIDMRWLDMGSQDVLDRLRSERANPQADVWFGAPSSLFLQAVADSLLMAYRPSWAEAVAERGRGPADFFFAAYETPAIIAYNSDALSPDEAPQDWDELLDPRWRGQVIIRDPLASGTMRTVFGMAVQRGLRATGDTAAGFDWLRRLDAQTREYVLNPALLMQKLVRREGLVTPWDISDILTQQHRGQPIGFILPSSGTPVIEDAIAIVRGTRRMEAARKFVEWVGSEGAQLLAAHEAFRVPARLDLPEDELPSWVLDVRARMVVEPMDWEGLGQHISAWMTHWDRTVRGRGSR